jgi:hypothetical protein
VFRFDFVNIVTRNGFGIRRMFGVEKAFGFGIGCAMRNIFCVWRHFGARSSLDVERLPGTFGVNVVSGGGNLRFFLWKPRL